MALEMTAEPNGSAAGLRPPQRRYQNAAARVAALKPSYPVSCVHAGAVKAAARGFLDTFPGRVLYAVKCNPHPLILKALYDEGIRHFDTASLAEVAQVRELFRDAECYFMHPVKGRSAIKTADEVYAVEHFVVDHMDELYKVLDSAGGERLAILGPIAPPSARAPSHPSPKFAPPPAQPVPPLQPL